MCVPNCLLACCSPACCRQRVGMLELEVQSVQGEVLEAKAELQRQQSEHEAAQAVAATRIAGENRPWPQWVAVHCLWRGVLTALWEAASP